MVWTDPNIDMSEKIYKEIFALSKKFDIKFYNDPLLDEHPIIPDLMCVFDRDQFEMGEGGEGCTHISSEIMQDMKPLWENPKYKKKK